MTQSHLNIRSTKNIQNYIQNYIQNCICGKNAMKECNEESSDDKVTIHKFASKECHHLILNDFDQ